MLDPRERQDRQDPVVKIAIARIDPSPRKSVLGCVDLWSIDAGLVLLPRAPEGKFFELEYIKKSS
jgi:hypothetical protein